MTGVLFGKESFYATCVKCVTLYLRYELAYKVLLSQRPGLNGSSACQLGANSAEASASERNSITLLAVGIGCQPYPRMIDNVLVSIVLALTTCYRECKELKKFCMRSR